MRRCSRAISALPWAILTSQALTTIGITDLEGAAIDINEILGKQANNFMSKASSVRKFGQEQKLAGIKQVFDYLQRHQFDVHRALDV